MYESEYPINTVCADAVVVKHGHVLVVERADNGKLACPGGHVGLDETTYEACIRELLEETGLDLKYREPNATRVFDDPKRSSRQGRIITHAFYFRLPKYGPLNATNGGDDAVSATWLNFDHFLRREKEFHDDHHRIISSFIGDLL